MRSAWLAGIKLLNRFFVYFTSLGWSSWWVSSGVPRYSTAKANICFSLVTVGVVAYVQRMPTEQAVITGPQCRNDVAFSCPG